MTRCTMFTLVVMTLAVLPAAPAKAEWNVGTDLGLSYFSPERGDGITTIGWGGSESVLLPIFQPGIRFGFTLGSLQNELVVTSTVMLLSASGNSVHSFQGMAAWQYNFAVERRTRFFVNAGIGLNVVGDDHETRSAPAFGAGVGTRQMMGHGYGSIRVEARFDHQNEFEESGFTVFPAANVFGLRVGWELWG